ncbi:unnamed protein product [Diamesa hyperborea]
MMTDLQIKLVDNLNACYYAGETLHGLVKLKTVEPLKVQGKIIILQVKNSISVINLYVGLCINFYGLGYCDWRNENIMKNVNSPGCSITNYKGKEEYLNTTVNLISDLVDISVGCTDIPFTFTLASSLPPSFNGKFGHIVYNMEAVLDYSDSYCKKVHRLFVVNNLYNLNLEPQLKIPIESEMIKEFVSLCCKKSRFYMSVIIPYTEYTSAENIKVCIKLANNSNINIEKTIISIRKIVSYNVKTLCKRDFETIVTTDAEGVESNCSKNIECNLKIPETITNINKQKSTIIQVEYDLIVSCIPGGCHFCPKLKIPITIGNIPLVFDEIKKSQQNDIIVSGDYLDTVKMSECTIEFDNNENGHYFAGQTMSGTVVLNLHEAKKCKGSEKYLENITYLFGSKDGESMTIEAGIRIYSFSYKLPSDLPYSIKKFCGFIRYTVKATLDIPWRFNVYDFKDFKICQNDDLNLYPDLKIPSEKQYEAKMCCLIQPKPLFFEASIPYTGYICGDTINVAINLINDRNYTLRVKIELVQKTTYTFRG